MSPNPDAPQASSGLLYAYSWFAAIATAYVVLQFGEGSMSLSAQMVITGAAIALFGVPHGAFDFHEGELLFRPWFGEGWKFFFLFAYLGIAAGVLKLWINQPTLTLMLFLLTSSLHFGFWDVSWRRSHRYLSGGVQAMVWLFKGSAFLLFMLLFHGAELHYLFAQLIPQSDRATLATAMDVLHAVRHVWLLGYVFSVALLLAQHFNPLTGKSFTEAAQHLLEEIVYFSLFLFFSPLLAFGFYFIVWHSARHSIVIIQHLSPGNFLWGLTRFIGRGAVVLAFLGTLVWLVATNVQTADVQPWMMRLIFYSLSAIAIPHLILGFVIDPKAVREAADSTPRRESDVEEE